jgi:hypothetical protein
VNRLRERDDATWPALAFVVAALAAVVVGALLLADSQSDQRRELRERYADRVDVATALIGSLLTVAYNGQRENAIERLGGEVDRALLDAEARRGSARYLLVLDGTGRAMASSSGTPGGTADRLAQRPAFVRRALSSRSGYGLGQLQEGGFVESAVSFPTEAGPRIVVNASPVAAFREFLSGSLEPLPQGREGRAWVFDSNGRTISSVNAPAGLRPAPELVQRSLREPMGEFTSPATGQERFFAADSIPEDRKSVV